MLFCMRDVSGLEAHACSVRDRSRLTGIRKRRFPDPPMVDRYFRLLPLLLSVFAPRRFRRFRLRSARRRRSRPAPSATAEKHEALPLQGRPAFHPREFTVTNSMLVTWVVALGIIVFAQAATRKIKPVPTGAQNFWEWMVEGLYNFLESVIGSHLVQEDVLVFRHDLYLHPLPELVRTDSRRRHDRLGASRSGDERLPRRSSAAPRRECRSQSHLRDGGGFLCALDRLGACRKTALAASSSTSSDRKGIRRAPEDPHDHRLLHGRLAGNRFDSCSGRSRSASGFSAMSTRARTCSNRWPTSCRALSWLIPIPFYFMELLVGIVQALVFMLLTAVFTLLIAQHEPAQGAHH